MAGGAAVACEHRLVPAMLRIWSSRSVGMHLATLDHSRKLHDLAFYPGGRINADPAARVYSALTPAGSSLAAVQL
jgi:hypothetical protein